jgi:hypothetical protein
VHAELKALACELPATTGVPLSRWSCAELARELALRAVVSAISAATVWRILDRDAIRPWLHRSWIFPRDPNFEAKAAKVLDLYARVWRAKPLGPDDYVLSADEKISIQARCRCHPSLPPGRARLMRVEHEYERAGAVCLPRRVGRAPGQGVRTVRGNDRDRGVQPSRRPGHDHRAVRLGPTGVVGGRQRIEPPGRGRDRPDVAAVAQRPAPAASRARLLAQPDRDLFLRRATQVVNPNDFTDTDEIAERLAAFEDGYNTIAEPFDWTFGRDDLAKFVARLERHIAA